MILAFGGYDPTGGAGLLMDARAIRAAGGHAAAVPSCLAVQSTASVYRVFPIPRDAMERSLSCAVKSFRIDAVKIGAVGTRAAALCILSFLAKNPRLPVVLDPVLRASSGHALLAENALPAYRKLLSRATVLTPNLPEAEKILARRIGSFGEAIMAARDLSFATGGAVVLKGGHFPWKGKRGVDIIFEERMVTLSAPEGKPHRLSAHGTGCALASAVATRIAMGEPLVDAARGAKSMLSRWIAEGFQSLEGRWTLFA